LNFALDNGAGRICYTEERIDNSLIFNELRWSGARIASALIFNELRNPIWVDAKNPAIG